MAFTDLPRQAAWRHCEARDGFEVAFFAHSAEGYVITGSTAAIEGDGAWAVRYDLRLNTDWSTNSARVSAVSMNGECDVAIELSPPGGWVVDGTETPQLDGCLDVDLESSALTNAFPVRRLGLEPGRAADAPAVYVRSPDLRTERIDQRYRRLSDRDGRQRYRYASTSFGFVAELVYDPCGLVTTYPGLAERVG